MSRISGRSPSRWAVRACALAVVLSAGCGLRTPAEGEVVQDSPARVAHAIYEVRVRHTDVVNVHVLFPSDDAGHVLPSAQGHPALVFVQGGNVPVERYFWLAQKLAERGYVTALPEHSLNLAFFAIDNAQAARELLASPPEGSVLQGAVDASRIGVAGHSLGGVVAVKAALGGGFHALALLASYPDSADVPSLPSLKMPVLVLAGEKDCSAKLQDVVEKNAALEQPKVFAVVDGVTHYQFTDSQKEDDERGCAPSVPLDAAHQRIAASAGLFLDAALYTGSTASAEIDGVEGVSVR